MTSEGATPAPRRVTRKGHTVDQRNPLAELFGSRARAEVVRILFGLNPAEVYISEITRRSGMAEQGIDEQLRVLGTLGLVVSRMDGNRRYFRANDVHPFYAELRSLVRKSSGLRDYLVDALAPLRVDMAFVFGSIARGEERPESDVDLMVLTEQTSREASPHLASLSENLGREVNSHFFSREEVVRRIQTADPFFGRVLESPKIFIVGDAEALEQLIADSREVSAS